MRSAPKGLPRLCEATVCLAALVVLLPVFVAVAIGIVVTSPGPVFFRQQRVGLHGTRFTIVKFRTMRTGQCGPHVTAATDSRVTAFGRLLRRSKIDELPELWNVVRGDLSIVGPRPEVTEYVDVTDLAWKEVLSVRPGLTDPTTLRLRNEEELLATAGSQAESFYRDVLLPYKLAGYREYLSSRTWQQDVAVIWSTLAAIVVPSRVPAPSPADVAVVQPTGRLKSTHLS